MPGLRVAVASGNWSNSATWDGGFFPIAGDTVSANGFTIAIDQNINVGRITNVAQTNTGVTATMTSNTTPSGYVASASSDNGGAQPAWRAFDRSPILTEWISSTGSPQWLAYQFPSAVIIDRYSFVAPGLTSRTPVTWTFEGSNDGITWTVLHSVTGAVVPIGSTYTSPVLGNSTSYTRYRLNVSVIGTPGSNTSVMELYLLEKNYTTLSSVAGGGFTLSGSYTLGFTFSDAIQTGSTTCLTYNAASPVSATINAVDIRGANTAGINSVNTTSTGTLNINAIITGASTNVASRTINIGGNGIINIVGNVSGGPSTSAVVVNVASVCTLNITGNITHTSGSSLSMLTVNAAATVNITGNIICGSTQTTTHIINIGFTAALLYITGNMSVTSTQNAVYCISSGGNTYINHIGTMTAGIGSPAVSITQPAAINLFTGPFVCSTYGFFPFIVARMHLIPTATGYMQFRDNSTNGAIQPGPIAPTVTYYPASTIADAPIPANVRSGVVYALGSQTGTLVVPAPGSVASGVVYDNGTLGTAVLTASAVWDALTSTMVTPGSIGERLKNSSTVATTGAQLAAFT